MATAKKCQLGCRGGHLRTPKGEWIRCSCLLEDIYKRDLGVFATKEPELTTGLRSFTDTSLLIEGPMSRIRGHIAGVILDLKAKGGTFTSMDAYRLVDIFLDKDEEFQGSGAISGYDLFVMLLGFGEVKNQRLPDLIMQVLARRDLLQKPTWVILGLPLGQVSMRFSSEVHDSINRFKKVQIR